MPVDDRVDHRLDRVVVADVAGVELVGQTLDRAPRAGHDGGALLGENRADAGADPANAAGHQHDPAGEPEVERGASVGVGHCASVPSKCLLRYTSPRKWSRISMTITSRTAEPGIVAVTVDYPPVNAIPSAGLVRTRRRADRRRRRPETPTR